LKYFIFLTDSASSPDTTIYACLLLSPYRHPVLPGAFLCRFIKNMFFFWMRSQKKNLFRIFNFFFLEKKIKTVSIFDSSILEKTSFLLAYRCS